MSKTTEYQNRLGAMQLGAAFALLFLVLHLLRHRTDPLFLWIAVVCLGAAVFFYRLLTPVLRVWMRFGNLLNKVIGPLVFGLLFYVFVTPVALLRRVLHGKGMAIGLAAKDESAWIDRTDEVFNPAAFEKQF